MGHAPPRRARVAVVTCSDTRTEADDTSGALCAELVVAAGHDVIGRTILPDEPGALRGWLRAQLEAEHPDAVLVNGGTGLAPRDTTVEAIEGLLTRRLDGFGELFRMLSFQEIGAKAMASRALAGAIDRTLIFLMPGSTKAVRLAMERLIGPELGHLVGELTKEGA